MSQAWSNLMNQQMKNWQQAANLCLEACQEGMAQSNDNLKKITECKEPTEYMKAVSEASQGMLSGQMQLNNKLVALSLEAAGQWQSVIQGAMSAVQEPAKKK